LIVDDSNDASWPKEVPFGYAAAKKYLGVYDNKTVEFFDAIGNLSLKVNAQ